MKSKIAYAIVSKKRPSIDIMELYTKEQAKDIEKHSLCKDEMIIQVIISPVVKPKKESKEDFEKNCNGKQNG